MEECQAERVLRPTVVRTCEPQRLVSFGDRVDEGFDRVVKVAFRSRVCERKVEYEMA